MAETVLANRWHRQPTGKQRLESSLSEVFAGYPADGGLYEARTKTLNSTRTYYNLTGGVSGLTLTPNSSEKTIWTGAPSTPIYGLLLVFDVRTAAITSTVSAGTIITSTQDATTTGSPGVYFGPSTGYVADETVAVVDAGIGRTAIKDTLAVGNHTLCVQWTGSVYEIWLDGQLTTNYEGSSGNAGLLTFSPHLGGRKLSGQSWVCPSMFAFSPTPSVDLRAYQISPFSIFTRRNTVFLPSAGGGGATITAATESLTLSTFGATVGSARDIAGALESLSLTPYAALVSRASAITAAVESISLGTYAATVANNATIAGGLESIALTANAASVTLGAAIAAAMESIVLAANPAAVRLDAAVAAQLEQITITGLGATVSTSSDVNIGAALESITLSVPQALVSSNRAIAGGLESIQITANGATVTLGALIGAALENIALTSYGAGITLNVALAGGLEQINLTTLAAQIGLGSNVAALVEAITLTEFGATLTMTGEITAALESIGLTTFVASVTGGESALTTPGLEFTIPVGRMHYSIPIGRIHFTIPRD